VTEAPTQDTNSLLSVYEPVFTFAAAVWTTAPVCSEKIFVSIAMSVPVFDTVADIRFHPPETVAPVMLVAVGAAVSNLEAAVVASFTVTWRNFRRDGETKTLTYSAVSM